MTFYINPEKISYNNSYWSLLPDISGPSWGALRTCWPMIFFRTFGRSKRLCWVGWQPWLFLIRSCAWNRQLFATFCSLVCCEKVCCAWFGSKQGTLLLFQSVMDHKNSQDILDQVPTPHLYSESDQTKNHILGPRHSSTEYPLDFRQRMIFGRC